MLGVVLAGGLARRMGGGDKTLLPLNGRPMLSILLERLAPQVSAISISANGDGARFGAVAPGVPVLADPLPGFPGPLAGILAGMDHAARLGLCWVLSVPGDTPLIPPDLAARLRAASSPIACAASAGRTHPPIALWPVGLREELRAAITAGEGKVSRWAMAQGCAPVEWPGDPFINANRPEDLPLLERAEREGA
ncbi:molybdenum cofactor guanylyltransferase [Roseomonas sp. SSH11]|uniref:Molybdenum cofactor guanylyltransferase n=1 Tax=Pararoseomonas baculiformis TaxID=2820812 RepID=A0ABS4AGX4_9PROT|nr:molybdenum cofactor guanylyltransferase [Pararoseomonas baculiformis]